ncbi:MAG: hypothetical protein LUF80_00150, partial [Oscillospiraceae bacterium]|nr:hypothetical protein [Oscillospiraceae bacterium]
DMIQSLCSRSHTTVVDIQKTLHHQFSTVCSAEAKSQLAKQKWNEKPFINQSGAYRCMDQNGDYRRMNRRIEEELNRVP